MRTLGVRAPLPFEEKNTEKSLRCPFCKNVLSVSDKIKRKVSNVIQCKKCGKTIHNNSIFY